MKPHWRRRGVYIPLWDPMRLRAWLLAPRDASGAYGERERHGSLGECVRALQGRAKAVLRARTAGAR